MIRRLLPAAGLAAVGLLLAVLPAFSGRFVVSLLLIAGIQTVITTGLSLLAGAAGQISMAQGAFAGLGAYGSAILSTKAGLSPWVTIPIAAATTGVVAYLVGRPTLKLKGHLLSLATLGLGIIVYILLGELAFLTGGPSGLGSIPRLRVGDLTFRTDQQFYYLAWAAALVGIALYQFLVSSPWGRSLKAIAASEVAAEAMGVDTARRKLEAFVLSAMYAAVGGSLLAHYMTFINPDQFGFMTSVQYLLMTAVGGLNSTFGPLIGVLTVTGLVELLREYVPRIAPDMGSEVEIVAYGLLLMTIMIAAPDGVAGLVGRMRRWWRKEVT